MGYCSNKQELLHGIKSVVKNPQTQHLYEQVLHQINRSSSHTKKGNRWKNHIKINFKMARQYKDRKGFSHNFKSPIGKRRRPTCPVCGYSEVSDRPEEWRWDSGERVKGGHCLATQGLSQTAGLGQEAWVQTPARLLGQQWQRWWEWVCILHGKQNWVTGLAWRIILVQGVKPSPLLQCDMGCDVELATQLLLFQECQSCLSALSKCGKNLGGEQGKPSRFSFHFLSFPFAHEPLCPASWKPELSPINGDGQVLRHEQHACAWSERAGARRVSPDV